MRKLIYFALLAVALSSCKKFLDLEPLAQENSGNYMNNEENAIKVINGIYDILSQTEGRSPDGLWMSHHYDFFFSSIATDDAVKGSKLSDMPELNAIESYKAQAGNSIADAFWIHGYWGISRCNYAIQQLPTATISTELKNRLMGEALFLRAYHYNYLLKHFGGIPLFAEPLNPSQFGKVERGTIHQTLEFIIKDLTEAINLLPERSKYAAKDLGRATKGAARSLLAKILAYQIGVDAESNRTWDDVYQQTQAVINSGEYNLTPNYATLFEYENKNSIESIFEVQAAEGTASDAPTSVGNAYPLFQGNRVSNQGANVGWGFHNPTQDLVNAFDPTDPRLSCTVYGIGYNGEVLYGAKAKFDRTEQGSNYLNRKAAIPFKPVLDKAANKNIIILRYADVLLLDAEAAYYTGKADPKVSLNKVRTRARNSSYCKGYVSGSPTAYTMPASTPNIPNITATGTALLDAILRERRLELALEGSRLDDLVRTGKLVEVLSKAKDTDRIGAGANDEVRHQDIGNNLKKHAFTGKGNTYIPVLPIPITEVQNWGIKNNPNY